jgi:hypothetical protein
MAASMTKAVPEVKKKSGLKRKSPEEMAAPVAMGGAGAAPMVEAEKGDKVVTASPLVSREQFRHNLKILTAMYKGTKIAAKDATLEEKLGDAFFHGRRPDATPAFLKALAYIYKKYESAKKFPVELDWMDWYTKGDNGASMLNSSSVVYGAIEHYFNIYAYPNGKLTDWEFAKRTNTLPGYLMGFSESESVDKLKAARAVLKGIVMYHSGVEVKGKQVATVIAEVLAKKGKENVPTVVDLMDSPDVVFKDVALGGGFLGDEKKRSSQFNDLEKIRKMLGLKADYIPQTRGFNVKNPDLEKYVPMSVVEAKIKSTNEHNAEWEWYSGRKLTKDNSMIIVAEVRIMSDNYGILDEDARLHDLPYWKALAK